MGIVPGIGKYPLETFKKIGCCRNGHFGTLLHIKYIDSILRSRKFNV